MYYDLRVTSILLDRTTAGTIVKFGTTAGKIYNSCQSAANLAYVFICYNSRQVRFTTLIR